jgi:hypothetical protein
LPRVILGLPDANAGALESAYFASMRDNAACDTSCRMNRADATITYGIRIPRTAWPHIPPDTLDLNNALSRGMAAGDTGAVRRAASGLDDRTRISFGAGQIVTEGAWAAPDGFLALGDTAAALRSARFLIDSVMPSTALVRSLAHFFLVADLWPRTMLLRARLAAATGSRAEARVWYDRVLDLWSDADEELQPEVARIRAARAALLD